MKALVLNEKGRYPELREHSFFLEEGKKRVELVASALNHRDVWISKGMYPGIKFPIILGSDGAGICDGEEVIINPSHDWGSREDFQSNNYKILGLPDHGCFAEYVNVASKYIFPKPGHLSFEEAAALPLAGLTAYRALMVKGRLKKGDHVLVTGAGGGVALFAIQFALAAGAKVYVSTGKKEKLERLMSLGVSGGVLYHEEDHHLQLKAINPQGFDVLVDGTGGKPLTEWMKQCKAGARVVLYGGTLGKTAPLNPQLLFWKQISILGTSMGSEKDFENMLSFVNLHKIRPVIDSIYNFDQASEAFERMDHARQFGKIVFKH